MKPKKVIYYKDELNDDFAGTSIRARKIGDNFVFIRKNPIWRVFCVLICRVIATPVALVTCRLVYGVRIYNRKVLRKLRGGYFLYGNHTLSVHDAFAPTMLAFPKRCYVITSPEAVSIPGLRNLVVMLGAIPVPDTPRAVRNFVNAIGKHIKNRHVVAIYPEAHIWPYYTGVRNFSDDSFIYPVKFGVPAVAFAVKYRERRFLKNRRPLVTIHVSQPFWPNPDLPARQARRKLRDEVYKFMREHVCTPDNAVYIRYEKLDNAE
ncbi:MAG: lysophospholipid acyltransferase family protein [Eubacteriales bacterium]|jgi:1-acyl-sn-glycerol-3-phosphate acyltransferase